MKGVSFIETAEETRAVEVKSEQEKNAEAEESYRFSAWGHGI